MSVTSVTTCTTTPTCTYTYSRGTKKGTVCGAGLRSATSKSQGLCSNHCQSVVDRNRKASQKLADECKERLYRVEVNNDGHKIYKKQPEGTIVKIVHEMRALQLQRLGCKITPIGSGSVASLVVC